MSDKIYADTVMLSSFSNKIRRYCSDILHAGQSMYNSTTDLAWNDDLTERTLEHYTAVVKIVERILKAVDGCDKILVDQLKCLSDYSNISV